MARTRRGRGPPAATAAAAATQLDRSRAAPRKKKPYKIVLEAVTQEKRKLKSAITYRDHAPPGFGYVPVGHPEITEWCKEQCRQRNLDVHIVSAKPLKRISYDLDKISAHVHRIGHHFPLEIIELACRKFSYRYSEARGLRPTRESPISAPAYVERGIANYEQRQVHHGKPLTDTEHEEHISGAIREIFPKIPDSDLKAIAKHAFKEGTKRVGNAKELSLARRVQLAVVAHIRHVHTDYDNILKRKGGTWLEAREQVEPVSLAKIKEWRDETDEASNELEETFREVIVLDDDDSSDDESSSPPDTREPSIEIVSSRATARDLQPEQVDRLQAHDPYVSRASRRTIVLRSMGTNPTLSLPPSPSDYPPGPRTSRADDFVYPPPQSPAHGPVHAAFLQQGSRADDFAYPPPHPLTPSSALTALLPQVSRADERALPLRQTLAREPLRSQVEPSRQAHGELPFRVPTTTGYKLIADADLAQPYDPRPRDPATRVAPQMMRDSAGQLYTLQPIDTNREPSRIAYTYHAHEPYATARSPYSNPVIYDPGHSRPRQPIQRLQYEEMGPQHGRPRLTPSSRRASDQDVILPSVEGEAEARVQKRNSFPHTAYEDLPATQHENWAAFNANRKRPAHDMQPRREVVPLTSNQSRSVYSSRRDAYEVRRPRAEWTEYGQAPMHPRRSPLGESRGAYREVAVPHSPRAYVSGYDRAYDEGVYPAMDRAALDGATSRYETRESLYMKSGAGNGYHGAL